MDQPTIMTAEQRDMLRYWRRMLPDMNVESLAENLIRRFHVTKNTAWILACRFNNEAVQ